MFVFQKIKKIQSMLSCIDIQNQRIFGNTERRLYRTEAEKIAKELKRSANLDFIELTVELIFREMYKEEFIYDPEKIEQISIFLEELINSSIQEKIKRYIVSRVKKLQKEID